MDKKNVRVSSMKFKDEEKSEKVDRKVIRSVDMVLRKEKEMDIIATTWMNMKSSGKMWRKTIKSI